MIRVVRERLPRCPSPASMWHGCGTPRSILPVVAPRCEVLAVLSLGAAGAGSGRAQAGAGHLISARLLHGRAASQRCRCLASKDWLVALGRQAILLTPFVPESA